MKESTMRAKTYAEKTPEERKISFALFEQHMLRFIERGEKRVERQEVNGCVVLKPRVFTSDKATS
jgi:hypothetical protein